MEWIDSVEGILRGRMPHLRVPLRVAMESELQNGQSLIQ